MERVDERAEVLAAKEAYIYPRNKSPTIDTRHARSFWPLESQQLSSATLPLIGVVRDGQASTNR